MPSSQIEIDFFFPLQAFSKVFVIVDLVQKNWIP